jgi:hypothetical protein
MRVLAIWIKRPLNVSVQRPQHADTGMQEGASVLRGHDQRLDCGLPFWKVLFGLAQLHDVVSGLLQDEKLLPSGSAIGSSKKVVHGIQCRQPSSSNYFLKPVGIRGPSRLRDELQPGQGALGAPHVQA